MDLEVWAGLGVEVEVGLVREVEGTGEVGF